MIIGTVMPEEAIVFDSVAGHHHDDEAGQFEVFWMTQEMATLLSDGMEEYSVGWHWWSCTPGCLPDGAPNGPFTSSFRAYSDATNVY